MAAIYDAYARRIYRYIYSHIGNAADVEDLTSQTFLGVLEALPRYRHHGQFAAWIFQIARFKAMNHFRLRRDISTVTEVLIDPQTGPLREDIIRNQAKATGSYPTMSSLNCLRTQRELRWAISQVPMVPTTCLRSMFDSRAFFPLNQAKDMGIQDFTSEKYR
ncbi:MAG: RNA polymerase sigma factor [Chloroflexota bacterium]